MNYENDAALGISATETTRNAAANDLYGKSFNDLDEAQKQLTLLQMVEDGNKLSGALGQAARETDGLENVLGNLKQAFTDAQAELGKFILDPVIAGLKALTKIINDLDFGKAVENIKSFIKGNEEMGEGVSGTALKIKEALSTTFGDLYAFLYAQTSENLSGITTFWKDNGAQIMDAVNNLFDGLLVIYETFYPVIKALTASRLSGILDIITSVFEYIGGVILVFTGLFTGDISKMWEGVKGIFSSQITFIVGLFKLSFVDDLVKALIGLISKVGSYSIQLWDRIFSAFSNGVNKVAIEIGRFVTNFVSELNKLPGRALSIIQNVANNMLSAARNLPSQFQSIGGDVVSGLIKGLGSLNPVNAIRKLAQNMIKAAKEEFDIHSPSREFASITDFVIQGITTTLDRNGGKAVDGMRKLTNDMLKEGSRLADADFNAELGMVGLASSIRGTALNLGSVISPTAAIGSSSSNVSTNNSRSQVNNITINTNEADVEAQRVTRRLAFAF